MSSKPDPYLWISAERFAADLNIRPSAVISHILDGDFEGMRHENRWYVARPRVTLYYPDPDDRSVGELRLLACRLGRYLTAARSEVGIPLRHDDPGREYAQATLMNLGEELPEQPAEITLDGQHWIVDCSLCRDLAAALVEFDLNYELGDALREFPPTAPELD